MLPPPPKFTDAAVVQTPADAIRVADTLTLKTPLVLDGLLPERSAGGTKIVAVRPNGRVEPLLWLYEYDDKHRHPFLLRKPLTLEPGTIIRGVKPPDSVLLLPGTSSGAR
jgi:hypothetical protein